jgi:hypothetical protein
VGFDWRYATMDERQNTYTDLIPIVAGFETNETMCGSSDEGMIALPSSIISATRVTTLVVDF